MKKMETLNGKEIVQKEIPGASNNGPSGGQSLRCLIFLVLFVAGVWKIFKFLHALKGDDQAVAFLFLLGVLFVLLLIGFFIAAGFAVMEEEEEDKRLKKEGKSRPVGDPPRYIPFEPWM